MAHVGPVAAQQADTGGSRAPNTIIIFDGSGSMWGDLSRGRDVKFQVARQALKASFAEAEILGNVGITAFGYRQRGTCGSSETITPIEPASPETTLSALDNWNPRGRGPIGAALRSAGEQLRDLPAPRRILLIHDDADNCGEDVCAISRSLKSDMPDLVIETVTLNEPTGSPLMACLADITDGNVAQSDDPAELDRAISAAVRRTLQRAGNPEPASASTAEQRRQPTAAELDVGVHVQPGPRQFVAIARVSGADKPLAAPMTWRIGPADGSGPSLTASRSEIKAQLVSGKYEVTARSGPFESRSEVTISDGNTTTLVVEFDAADVGITVDQPGGRFTRAPLLAMRKAGAEKPLLLRSGYEFRQLLEPGEYVVTATLGLTQEIREFTAEAGTVAALELSLPTGLIDVSVAGGGQDDTLNVSLIRIISEPASDGGPVRSSRVVEIARSAARSASVFVPPGIYRVVLDSETSVTERRVIVVAGARVPVRLDQTGGTLMLQTRIAGRGAPEKDGISYLITADDGRTIRPIRLHDAEAQVRLEPGRYRISSILTASGLTSARTVIVTPGMQETLEVEHAVGALRLVSPSGVSGAGAAQVFWDIRNSQGERIWRDIGTRRTALLSPGIYRVRAVLDGRTRETTATVRLGETSDVVF